MNVSQDYAQFIDATSYNSFAADTTKTKAVADTPKKAQAVVDAHAGETDYQKLVSYREYIKREVFYNTGAAGGGYPYGDPWQLIYVFDGNFDTNVVCEGYAKAFQYLCDLTFQNQEGRPSSALVSGKMDGGDHMWNIVAIGGRNYLVDVTNCDDRSIGAPDQLFLCGAAENEVSKKYTVALGKGIVYVYDEKTVESYAPEHLKLSPVAYDPNAVSAPSVSGTVKSYGSASEAVTVTLLQGTSEVATKTLTGASGTVPYSQSYAFPAVPAGEYTLKVEKKGHAPWTESITVDSAAIAKDVTVYLWGDVNRDGDVTAADAQEIQRKAAKLSSAYDTEPNKSYWILRADVNRDGKVTAADAQEIQRNAAKLSSAIDSLP